MYFYIYIYIERYIDLYIYIYIEIFVFFIYISMRTSQHPKTFPARTHARSSPQRAAMPSKKGSVRAECNHQKPRLDKTGALHESTAQAGTPAAPRSRNKMSHEDDKAAPPQGAPPNCDAFASGSHGDKTNRRRRFLSSEQSNFSTAEVRSSNWGQC